MSDYRAPIDDIRFALRHVAGLEEVAALDGFEHSDSATVEGLLDEAGRFFEEVVAPLNRVGDQIGSVRNDDGTITVPPGFDEAYQRYVEAGWSTVGFPSAYDGGGFPWLVNLSLQEMMTSANLAFSLCPMLTQGAIDALLHYGTEQQKETYLRHMVLGEWTGTMNMTEPEAGSDVGALTTKAVPNDDGSWRITGQKIYITWGEHDMTENIVHLVLARTPDSPPGTKGISLFVVPKFLVDDDGSLGERNDVQCVSIEHKLGINASPTCVMAFGDNGGATGWLLGEERQGMRVMFTMMNNARLAVGLEGVGVSERAYQQARTFANERRQGRAAGADPSSPSPIVDHPDVQRMLLDMRSGTAAIRGLCYRTAAATDKSEHGATEADRNDGAAMAALFTPLAKAWSTDLACEITSLGVQIHGGMGYIEETGAAQHFRDARITPIYEGTNGIQAIDLVGRKVPMDGGDVIRRHLASMRSTATRAAEMASLAPAAAHLTAAVDALDAATSWLLDVGATAPAAVLPGATSYLEMLAVTTGGETLIAGALSADAADEPDAADRAVMARFFAANRMARVPGMGAGVTDLGPELAAAHARFLTE
ncbi:MAG: acyl-CoA dehydrogenase family protein [Acidimicrobiales bacterium]